MKNRQQILTIIILIFSSFLVIPVAKGDEPKHKWVQYSSYSDELCSSLIKNNKVCVLAAEYSLITNPCTGEKPKPGGGYEVYYGPDSWVQPETLYTSSSCDPSTAISPSPIPSPKPTTPAPSPTPIAGCTESMCSAWDGKAGDCSANGQFNGKPSCTYCVNTGRCACGSCPSGTEEVCGWCDSTNPNSVLYERDPSKDRACPLGKFCFERKEASGTECKGACRKANPFDPNNIWRGDAPSTYSGISQCSYNPLSGHYRYLGSSVWDNNCAERAGSSCSGSDGSFNCNNICCGEMWPSSSSSSSSSQASSAQAQICVENTNICSNGTAYECILDPFQNRTYWKWNGECEYSNCNPLTDDKCENGLFKKCMKQTVDDRTYYSNIYNRPCSFANCTKNQGKCENGIGYYCWEMKDLQTTWIQYPDSLCQSVSCVHNQTKCESGNSYYCTYNSTGGLFWRQFAPCSFTGYPAPPARPSGSSSSSSSSSVDACPLKRKGDADCHNNINDLDYGIWKCEYLGGGQCANPVSNRSADFDGNTSITLRDFEIWRENQVSCVGPLCAD